MPNWTPLDMQRRLRLHDYDYTIILINVGENTEGFDATKMFAAWFANKCATRYLVAETDNCVETQISKLVGRIDHSKPVLTRSQLDYDGGSETVRARSDVLRL
jgi:hypothetical protein